MLQHGPIELPLDRAPNQILANPSAAISAELVMQVDGDAACSDFNNEVGCPHKFPSESTRARPRHSGKIRSSASGCGTLCRRSERRSESALAVSGARLEKFTPDRDSGPRTARVS